MNYSKELLLGIKKKLQGFFKMRANGSIFGVFSNSISCMKICHKLKWIKMTNFSDEIFKKFETKYA